MNVMAWFQLNNQLEPTKPASYTPAGSPLPSCSGQEQICIIDAPDDGNGKPVIDSTVLANMVNALNSRQSSETVHLKDEE
jgi:hypothetical protein